MLRNGKFSRLHISAKGPAQGESGPVCAPTHAAATLDQAMAVPHRMDGAFCWNWNSGKSEANARGFASTPAGVLVLHVQDKVPT